MFPLINSELYADWFSMAKLIKPFHYSLIYKVFISPTTIKLILALDKLTFILLASLKKPKIFYF